MAELHNIYDPLQRFHHHYEQGRFAAAKQRFFNSERCYNHGLRVFASCYGNFESLGENESEKFGA